MNNKILLNVLMNIVLGAIFVFLNNWALKNSFEETFISLALFYGAASIIGNALYISIFYRK